LSVGESKKLKVESCDDVGICLVLEATRRLQALHSARPKNCFIESYCTRLSPPAGLKPQAELKPPIKLRPQPFIKAGSAGIYPFVSNPIIHTIRKKGKVDVLCVIFDPWVSNANYPRHGHGSVTCCTQQSLLYCWQIVVTSSTAHLSVAHSSPTVILIFHISLQPRLRLLLLTGIAISTSWSSCSSSPWPSNSLL
jgi:hypothetical protein